MNATRFRFRPKDEYSTASGVEIEDALREEFDRSPEAFSAAFSLVFAHLIRIEALSNDDALSVLNTSRWSTDYEWEVAR